MVNGAQGFKLHGNQCNSGAEHDGNVDGKGEKQTVMTEMLAEKDEHRFVKHVHVAITVFLRALAFVMHDGRGHVVVFAT